MPGRFRAVVGRRVAGACADGVLVRDGASVLTVLATSSRVAPGLLSWAAWEALRSAAVVLPPAGHPQRPALDDAGVAYRIVDEPGVEPPASDGVV